MCISSLKSHALYNMYIQLSAYYYTNIMSASMSVLATFYPTARSSCRPFIFIIGYTRLPDAKQNLNPVPFCPHPSAGCNRKPFKASSLKLKTIHIAMQPIAVGTILTQHTPYKWRVLVGRWFYTGPNLLLCLNNGINVNQWNDSSFYTRLWLVGKTGKECEYCWHWIVNNAASVFPTVNILPTNKNRALFRFPLLHLHAYIDHICMHRYLRALTHVNWKAEAKLIKFIT
jgi:hypothetical protein